MRIVVFGDEKRVGALLGDVVVDLEHASQEARLSSLSAVPADLGTFIEAGDGAVEHAQRIVRMFSASPKQRMPRAKVVYRLDSVA